MRRILVFLCLAISLAIVTLPAAAQESEVVVLEVEGAITPALATYLQRGIQEAEGTGATAIVVTLDTPGGLVDSTQAIIQQFRASAIPIIVYVTPRGAQAASAGSLITMAGHAAAMAPETVIGAASPVGGDGAELEATLYRKVSEDLKATVRNLTSGRGESATILAEAMIDDARAVTAEEALAAGLIDAIANDVPELLDQLDGHTVIVQDQPRQLATAGAPTQAEPPTFTEQALLALANPLLIGILLTLGVQAILIELSSPGGWVAGVIGVLAIGLALFGLGQLPVNWFGLGLIVLAFVLFLMEVKAATHGALAATGLALLVAGLLVLFNSPSTPDSLHLSLPAAGAIAGVSGLFFILIAGQAIRAQRAQPATGAEGLPGRTGIVRGTFSSDNFKAPYQGQVLVAGELWQAQSAEELSKGAQVRVTAVNGIVLTVETQDS